MSEGQNCGEVVQGSLNPHKGSHQFNSPILNCYCGEVAPIMVSRTDLNPGKPFYTCHLPRKHVANCQFFKWVADVKDAMTPGLIRDPVAQSQNGVQMGIVNDEQVLLLKELVKNGEMLIEEIREARLKNEIETFIQEIRLLKEASLKNDTFVQEMRLMRGCVLGLGLVVLLVLMVLVYVAIVQ